MNSPLRSQPNCLGTALFQAHLDVSGQEGASVSFGAYAVDKVVLHAMVPDARITQALTDADLVRLIQIATEAREHLSRCAYLARCELNENELGAKR